MTPRHRATVLAVLEALKSHGCIARYIIDEEDGRPDWCDGGFATAFAELKTNPRPFGLKKNERAWLMIVLAQKDKKAVDDWTLNTFKQNYGL